MKTLLVALCILCCVLQHTSGNLTYWIQSYARSKQGVTNSYLNYHADRAGRPAGLSFDGTKSNRTKFVFERVAHGLYVGHNIRLFSNRNYTLGMSQSTTKSELVIQRIPTQFFRLKVCDRFVSPAPPNSVRIMRLQPLSRQGDRASLYIVADDNGDASFTDCVDDKRTWLVLEQCL